MRLKSIRIERNLTQKQIADALGLSTMAIQNYENNRRKPTYDVFIALGKYLGVSLDYLAGLTDNPKINV